MSGPIWERIICGWAKCIRAAEVLQQAYQRHPHHFAVVANLGTAWQRLGNLERSAALLEQAVSLAPPSLAQV
jgi:Flp pilus assembly protein TadD